MLYGTKFSNWPVGAFMPLSVFALLDQVFRCAVLQLIMFALGPGTELVAYG